tara:strand:+ start:351 stop:1175 length:825 start_codon:yes stop_codon:yes gene_type:complete
MIKKFKHQFVKVIEKFPLLQIFIYNNLQNFKFLFPHDKDYYALNILFNKNEKRAFIDVGGNIGLSSIGFRELGFKNNKIIIFEPDKLLIKNYLLKIKKEYSNLKIYPFGLSNKNSIKKLYRAFYKKKFFHFNNSFSYTYIKKKLFENYGIESKKFKIRYKKLTLKKFDSLNLNLNSCFIKIDVEGFDHHVIYGMKKFIFKFKPVILVEYNKSNFYKIYKFLKKYYDIFFYDFNKNKLIKLSKSEILKLNQGIILEKKFKKNSVNIFFINKNYRC